MATREAQWASPMSKKGTIEAIQDALGGGANISAANPLPVTPGTGVGFNVTTIPGSVVDVIDRAGRLVGIVYGNQAQLQQNPGTLELITEDTGANTNPERWLHCNHWEPAGGEVVLTASGAAGATVVDGPIVAGTRRVREVTTRNAGSRNTVITVYVPTGRTVLSYDVPAQTTRTWSSQDGRAFTATESVSVMSSDVFGGFTYISLAGVSYEC